MKKFRIFPLFLALCLIFTAAAPSARALDGPQLQAKAALLVDLDTGDILYERNKDEQRSPASLTKIMTGLLTVEAVESGYVTLDDVVTAGPDCRKGLNDYSSNVNILPGEQMTLKDLLCCALIKSANEACNVIGSYLAGDIDSFVEQMNERAKELGCTGTRFADPNGLSNAQHYTTAYDLYLITKEALTHPVFAQIVNTEYYQVPETNKNPARDLHNSNALLTADSQYGSEYLYEYAAGVKTGYTRQAGYCLVSTAEKDGVRVMAVVMGCGGPLNTGETVVGSFADTISLYDWVFENFSYHQILSPKEPLEQVVIQRTAGDGSAVLHVPESVSLLLPNDVDAAERSVDVTVYADRLVAPVSAETVLGEATVTVGGRTYRPVSLVANRSFTAASPASPALAEPDIQAQAALLVNLDTGEILYERSRDEQRSPASLTKIMTGLLAVEAVESGQVRLDDIVTAGPDCQNGMDSDSSNVGIVSGEQMTFQDLLYCALVKSANEACNVIASYLAGDIGSFVNRMNERAAELSCVNTHFSDPNGLSNENHYTTAYDLYRITREAMRHPLFAQIVNTGFYQVPATNVSQPRDLFNSNALITTGSQYGSDYLYEYASGVKTGYTRLAGYCLISTAEKDDVRVMAVVMGCGGPLNTGEETVGSFVDSVTLYNWVFDNFSYHQILTAAEPLERVVIQQAEGDGNAILRVQNNVSLLLPNTVDPAERDIDVTVYEDRLVAPIPAGTVLGEATVTVGGKTYGPIALVTNVDIGLSKGQMLQGQLQKLFSKTWVKITIIVVLVVLILYSALVMRYRALRKKHLKAKRQAEQRRRAAAQQGAGRPAPVREPTQRFETFDPNTLDIEKYFDQK